MTRPTQRINATDERRKEFSTIETLLREILARLDSIERRLPAVQDSTHDIELAQAIHAAAGTLPFTAADVMEHAEIIFDATPVLRATMQRVLGHPTARAVSKWLGDHEGTPIGGLRFVRAGSNREGLLWVCEMNSSSSRRVTESDATPCALEEPE